MIGPEKEVRRSERVSLFIRSLFSGGRLLNLYAIEHHILTTKILYEEFKRAFVSLPIAPLIIGFPPEVRTASQLMW